MDRFVEARKPRKCPACGSNIVAAILYGMPDMSEELQSKIESGNVVLGGCCQEMNGPVWQCSQCGTSIYKKYNTQKI